jgi:hypothetical protein
MLSIIGYLLSYGGLPWSKKLLSFHHLKRNSFPCNFLEFHHFKQIVSTKICPFQKQFNCAKPGKVLQYMIWDHMRVDRTKCQKTKRWFQRFLSVTTKKTYDLRVDVTQRFFHTLWMLISFKISPIKLGGIVSWMVTYPKPILSLPNFATLLRISLKNFQFCSICGPILNFVC